MMGMTRRRLLEAGALAWPGAALAAAPPRRLRILILGGTGFTGPHQVRYALSRGHTITLFNRGRRPKAWPGEVEELVGDRNASDLAALAGREWDVCIDNPTTLPFWVRDAGRALKGRVGRYVFISTLSVYAANDAPADESAALAPYDGADPMAETLQTLQASGGALYGPLKAASEREALRQFGDDAVTIIRPGLIVGPGDETDRFTYWPVRIARGGEVLAPGDGADPVQFIDARDLAEWTVRMAEQGAAGAFNATGPAEPMSLAEMLGALASTIPTDAKLTWVSPKFLAEAGVSPWSDLPVWIPAHGEMAGFARRDIGRALAQGLTFRPLSSTAVDTLAWFRTLPAERQAELRAGLTPEREAELLAQWKAQAG